MISRTIAAVAAVCVAVQIVRTAAVDVLAQANPDRAALVWSGHPATELSLARARIARSGVQSGGINLLADAARKEPLAAEPFLFKAVEAQRAGDIMQAQRLFEAAQWRDPHSLAAAYFLAGHYLQIGQISDGLRQLVVLAQLAPPAAAAPYVDSYARYPKTWPTLRLLFRSNPRLGDTELAKLASRIETVPATLSLAPPNRQWRQAPWFASLLETLTEAGQYERARGLWADAVGAKSSGQLLYDSSFNDGTSPPPFNWSLISSTVGLAERRRGGGLHVIFYGKEGGFLASQLLLLPPGSYALMMQVQGDPARAHALNWSVWCDNSGALLVSSTLVSVAAKGLRFKVPASCPAQLLRLGGAPSGVAQQTDLSIRTLRLQKVDTRA